jgi:hypothetical protein
MNKAYVIMAVGMGTCFGQYTENVLKLTACIHSWIAEKRLERMISSC